MGIRGSLQRHSMSEEDNWETDWCVGTATKRGIISRTAKKAEEMGALPQWHPSSRGRAGSMLSGLYRMGKYRKDKDPGALNLSYSSGGSRDCHKGNVTRGG